MSKLRDILKTPLGANTYLVHDEYDIGWIPVGGLWLNMLPPRFWQNWEDILDACIVSDIADGAYGREIVVTNVDADRLSEFPFVVLRIPEMLSSVEG